MSKDDFEERRYLYHKEMVEDFFAVVFAGGFDAGDVRQIGVTVSTPAAGTNGTLTLHLDTVVF